MTVNTSMAGTPSLLRSLNDRTTLGLLIDRGVLSRADICQGTGLSKPTAGQCLQRLAQLGLISKEGTRPGHVGPAAQLYVVEPTAAYGVAIDVADDEVRAVVVTPGGDTLVQQTVAPGGRDAVQLLTSLFRAVTSKLPSTEDTLFAMVVGVAGAYDEKADVVRHAGHLVPRILGLDAPGLTARLEAAIDAKVTIENDVKLVALAESAAGAARDAATSVTLWARGGVGAAIVMNGRVHRGATGAAGELGYLPVADSPATRPGEQEGGFQAWANREAVMGLAHKHGLEGEPRALIAQAAASESEASQAFLAELADRYATGLTALIAVIDPDLVVLSGSYMFAGGQVLTSLIAEAVDRRAMREVPVVLGQLSAQPVLAGAAHLARRQLRTRLLDKVGPSA